MIDVAPKLVKDLNDVKSRETVLYCGTMALNETLAMGIIGDWATHQMEHAVSAVYDIPHAGGLAILFPNWMNYCIEENSKRFYHFAVDVFDINPQGKTELQVGYEGIQALRTFWNSIGAPSTLSDFNITNEHVTLMAEKAVARFPIGQFKKLTREDVEKILTASL